MYRRFEKHKYLLKGKLLNISSHGHLFLKPYLDYSFDETIDTSFPEVDATNLPYENNEFAEAISFYDEALIKDSTFVDAWNNRGLALMKYATASMYQRCACTRSIRTKTATSFVQRSL